jgi:transposase
MRKGFEGPYGMARDRLRCDPLSGRVFLFANAQRNRLKLLFWDGSGQWVCAKRLEKGRFRWPETTAEESKVVLSHEELVLLTADFACSRSSRRRTDLGVLRFPLDWFFRFMISGLQCH